jgi:hypothetical protein
MYHERILVVANSRKTGGRCVAGVSLRSARLVRPVSTRGNGELSDRECGVGWRTPRLLEVVSFAHRGREGDPAQPENVVIANTPWKLEGLANPGKALALLLKVADRGSALFVNRGRAVPETVAAEGLDCSLALIEPEHLRFGHGPSAEAHAGSPRALFEFGGRDWSLPVTDFDFGPKIFRMPAGVYGWADLGFDKPERALLTTSLGAAHAGWHHKLVAAVIRFG